jgi:hypothetical protein
LPCNDKKMLEQLKNNIRAPAPGNADRQSASGPEKGAQTERLSLCSLMKHPRRAALGPGPASKFFQ